MHVAAAVGTPTLVVMGNDENAVGASPNPSMEAKKPSDRENSEYCNMHYV